jgi:hypothetical protein
VTGELLDEARLLLEANTREGWWKGQRYVFTVPSASVYPFQWFWDSCFHAIVWAQIDVERAREELRSLFAHQSSSGQLPQIVLWDSELVSRRSWHHVEAQGRLDWLLGRKPWTSVQIQPPVIAQAVEAIVDAGAAELLTETLPALERHYRFLAEHRDPDGDGLISIISQYESGLDFSPVFDAAPGEGPPVPVPSYLRARLTQLRNKLLGYDHPGRVFRWSPRHHEDVLVNAIYADGLDALARLAARAGSHTLEAWARDQAATVLEALVERCYDERRGFFFNLAGRGERWIDGVLTVGGLVPLVLAGLPEEPAGRLAEHLADPRRFWTAYPVPSVAVDEPSFVPDSRPSGRRRIWRGPCSMNTNWLLVLGLRRHGRADLAEDLSRRSRELVRTGGFNEFYDPLSGAPVGAAAFGWATLAAVL